MTDLGLVDTRVIDPDAPQYNASIVKRVDMHESLIYVWVKFDGEATPFLSGQYMTIGVFVDGRIVQRPYSVASPPYESDDTGYEFYVRLVHGGQFTPLLWRLPVGHRMRMIGPKGKFTLEENDDRTHLFISTGTGNAPFVAMMKALLREGRPRRAIFVNGVSYEETWATGICSRAGSAPANTRWPTCRRCRARPTPRTPAGPGGPAAPRPSWPARSTSSA